MDYKGVPLAVDNGEMIDTQNDRVFSEKLHDPRTGKSFAESSKKLEILIKYVAILHFNVIKK